MSQAVASRVGYVAAPAALATEVVNHRAMDAWSVGFRRAAADVVNASSKGADTLPCHGSSSCQVTLPTAFTAICAAKNAFVPRQLVKPPSNIQGFCYPGCGYHTVS